MDFFHAKVCAATQAALPWRRDAVVSRSRRPKFWRKWQYRAQM